MISVKAVSVASLWMVSSMVSGTAGRSTSNTPAKIRPSPPRLIT
jgi:hypothetical protein